MLSARAFITMKRGRMEHQMSSVSILVAVVDKTEDESTASVKFTMSRVVAEDLKRYVNASKTSKTYHKHTRSLKNT